MGDETRKNELILFYMEPLSGFGVRLGDLQDGEPGKQMAEAITRRSRAAFAIIADIPCPGGPGIVFLAVRYNSFHNFPWKDDR